MGVNMDYRKRDNGWLTFHEHWGFVLVSLSLVVMAQVGDFFLNLNGRPWINVFWVGTVLLVSGAVLIGYAKMPVYRSGRFFTFGVKSLPVEMKVYYRWGWRVFLAGVFLALGLMLAK
jgi:hypothetical protein